MGISKMKNAAPSAKGHGVETASKEPKAPNLYSLMRQAQTIAKELPLTDPSVELMDAIHTVIGILDDLEGDPDSEPELGAVEGVLGWGANNTDDREIDEDFEPSLGSLNVQLSSGLQTWPPSGPVYTPLFLTPSSQSQANWAAGTCDDIEFDPLDYGEHDPAELGELTEHGFANPDDPCSDVFAKGGRNA